MNTYRNISWAGRNYECTNVIICQSVKAPNENWILCEESIIDEMGLQKLHIENNVRYFGFL